FVGQDRVVGRGAHRAVPDVLAGTMVRVEQGQGLVEEVLEVPLRDRRVTAGVGGHAVEGSDQVRVDVLLVGAVAVQVVQEPEGVAALPVDPGDQAASLSCPLATLSAARWTACAARCRSARAAAKCGTSASELSALAIWLTLLPAQPS